MVQRPELCLCRGRRRRRLVRLVVTRWPRFFPQSEFVVTLVGCGYTGGPSTQGSAAPKSSHGALFHLLSNEEGAFTERAPRPVHPFLRGAPPQAGRAAGPPHGRTVGAPQARGAGAGARGPAPAPRAPGRQAPVRLQPAGTALLCQQASARIARGLGEHAAVLGGRGPAVPVGGQPASGAVVMGNLDQRTQQRLVDLHAALHDGIDASGFVLWRSFPPARRAMTVTLKSTTAADRRVPPHLRLALPPCPPPGEARAGSRFGEGWECHTHAGPPASPQAAPAWLRAAWSLIQRATFPFLNAPMPVVDAAWTSDRFARTDAITHALCELPAAPRTPAACHVRRRGGAGGAEPRQGGGGRRARPLRRRRRLDPRPRPRRQQRRRQRRRRR